VQLLGESSGLVEPTRRHVEVVAVDAVEPEIVEDRELEVAPADLAGGGQAMFVVPATATRQSSCGTP